MHPHALFAQLCMRAFRRSKYSVSSQLKRSNGIGHATSAYMPGGNLKTTGNKRRRRASEGSSADDGAAIESEERSVEGSEHSSDRSFVQDARSIIARCIGWAPRTSTRPAGAHICVKQLTNMQEDAHSSGHGRVRARRLRPRCRPQEHTRLDGPHGVEPQK